MKRILLVLMSVVFLTSLPAKAEDFLLHIGQAFYANSKMVVFSRGTTKDEPHLCILHVEHNGYSTPLYVKKFTDIHFEGLVLGIRNCTPNTIELSIEKQVAQTENNTYRQKYP